MRMAGTVTGCSPEVEWATRGSRDLVVGIGEGKVTDRADRTLVTYSLGSCVAVAVLDPVARIGGMVHCMLPSGSGDPERSLTRPGMYVDTGVARLLEMLTAMGASRRRLAIKAAGGAEVLLDRGLFEIGRRNVLALRKALWTHQCFMAAGDLGGRSPRTFRLEMATGRTTVQSGGREREL